MKDNHYNLMVIGGGICGLYQAYSYLKKYPSNRVCIIEKSDTCGGRALQHKFNGYIVPGGAGIGRLKKDRKLYKLINELGLPTTVFRTNARHYGIKRIVNVKDIVRQLSHNFNAPRDKDTSFKEFATRVLGQHLYAAFVESSGYCDFELMNAYDALHSYGFDDLYNDVSKFTVPWNEVVSSMESIISTHTGCTIYYSTTVAQHISKSAVKLSSGETISFGDYVIAIPPSSISKSLQNFIPSNVVLSKIKYQPFAYVYVKIEENKVFQSIFNTYTIVPAPLHKIIPIDSNNGIYMIAYCDNASAVYVKNHFKSNLDIERIVWKTLRIKIKVTDYSVLYHKIGTHYRTSFDVYSESRHLKGEAFAFNQGWTNGGL